MSNNVQLVNMKPTAATNGKANGSANGGGFYFGFPSSGSGPTQGSGNATGPGAGGVGQQNGFIVNRDYGDFDTNPSPTRADEAPTVPAQPHRQQPRSRPISTKPAEKFIPEHEIEIPGNGSLHDYTTDDMSTFLRYLGVDERIVAHVHKKGLDGYKFSKLKDADLEVLGMKNPIICHFRDRSIREKGGKKKLPFML